MSTRIHDSNRRLVPSVAGGALRNLARNPTQLRYHVLRDLWSAAKRLAAAELIENIEFREVPVLRDAAIDGCFVDDRNRAVLAALCRGVGARSFFEIGTNRGRTAWTVARSNPALTVHTLDLPDRKSISDAKLAVNDSDLDFFRDPWDRGEAFADTQEENRIVQHWGDSATFDFGPFEGQMDVVFVDGAHSHAYVASDTRAAMRMVSPGGVVVWDDYPAIPGVYAVLLETARAIEPRPFHVIGTRLVVWSTRRLVEPVADHGALTAA